MLSGKVLILTEWFAPGYKAGGPIRSIQNMVMTLPFEFYIITTDKDWGDDQPYTHVATDCWIDFSENVKVWYASDGLSNECFTQLITEVNPEVLYLNSMFSWTFTWRPILTARNLKFQGKVVLAPRGMLHPNAMKIKQSKKRLFLAVIKWMGWSKNLHWQATSAEEVKYVQQYFGDETKVSITENLPTLSPIKERPISKGNRWLMVNRLSEEKGVLEGLEWWVSHPLSSHCHLTIIGSSANAVYQEKIERFIVSNANKFIQWIGDVPPQEVTDWMRKSDFLFAPTRGENYGHAIAEAIFMGLPVVVAEGTPWVQLKVKNWGWNFGRSATGLKLVLDEVEALSDESYVAMHDALMLAREEEIKKIHDSQSWMLLFSTK